MTLIDADLLEVWKGMEIAAESGKAKAVGVSNFSSEQCERIMKNAKVPISANQVELHAYFQQTKLRDALDKLDIKVMAYAPLGSRTLISKVAEEPFQLALENSTVAEIAKGHGKTPAQVLLRHLVQLGIIVVPMSTNPSRIQQNHDIFDFTLTKEEIAKMNDLDKGSAGRTFGFDFFPTINKYSTMKEYPFIERDRY